ALRASAALRPLRRPGGLVRDGPQRHASARGLARIGPALRPPLPRARARTMSGPEFHLAALQEGLASQPGSTVRGGLGAPYLAPPGLTLRSGGALAPFGVIGPGAP